MADPTPPGLAAGSDPFRVDPATLPAWRDVERDALGCTRCTLAEHRTKVVFGTGPTDAELLLLGTAPGRQEDVLGQPFQGAAGNVVTNSLAQAGIPRDDVYITNLVKCHPPDSRPPEPAELEACAIHLFAQLAHVRPRVIVTFGELPTWVLLRRRVPIDRVAGYRLDVFDGVTLVPTWDPILAVKGNPTAMRSIGRDLATAKAVLDGRLSSGKDAVADAMARRDGGS
ncbi:MAG: uracil-DNA glycosylase [Actinomycetes bacterium]